MPTCLIELIKPHMPRIDMDEVARHLKITVADILEVQFWAFSLWLRVRSRGAVFVSPRKLSIWIPAIKEAIACCRDIESLERLKSALEVDFKKKQNKKIKEAIYSDKLQAELRQLVEQRWQQIKVETAALRQAEGLTQSYEAITEQCNEQESLDAVAQLIRKNHSIFEPFPYLLQHLRQVWRHRQAELLNLLAYDSTFTPFQKAI